MQQPGSTRSFGRAAAACATALLSVTSLLAPAADAAPRWRLPESAREVRLPALVQPADIVTGSEMWRQWDLGPNFGVDSALAAGDGAGIVVAVLDTGFVPHPELAGRWLPGYDFVSSTPSGFIRFPGSAQRLGDIDGDVMAPAEFGRVGRDPNPQDPGNWFYLDDGRLVPSTWHGTHVAGVIGAANDSTGISGIAPGARLLPVRVLGWSGGLYSDIADGIVWASGEHVPGVPDNRHPADVINLSMSVTAACPVELQRAIAIARANGAIVVAAAGNSGSEVASSAPANCAGVVAVAASDSQGKLAAYSNFGAGIDFTAPGGSYATGIEGGVYSTVSTAASGPGDPAYDPAAAAPGYAYMQGTSMAAPHVAAVLALIAASHPTWDESRILDRARSLTRPLADGCTDCGSGLISALSSQREPVLPTVDRLSSSRGAAGTGVRILGEHLDAVSNVEVGGQPAAFVLLRDGSLLVAVPLGADNSGLVLRNPRVGESTVAFEVLPGRASTRPSPVDSTRLLPGQDLVVTGPNVGVALKVRIGGVAARATALGVDRLRVRVPLGAKDGRLELVTALGAAVGRQRLSFPPRVLTAELSGRAGQTLTVVGENLESVKSVLLHGVRVRPSFTSATRLKFVVPGGARSSYARLGAPGGKSGKFWFERVS